MVCCKVRTGRHAVLMSQDLVRPPPPASQDGQGEKGARRGQPAGWGQRFQLPHREARAGSHSGKDMLTLSSVQAAMKECHKLGGL